MAIMYHYLSEGKKWPYNPKRTQKKKKKTNIPSQNLRIRTNITKFLGSAYTL